MASRLCRKLSLEFAKDIYHSALAEGTACAEAGRLQHSDGLSHVAVVTGGRRPHHGLGVTADRLGPGLVR